MGPDMQGGIWLTRTLTLTLTLTQHRFVKYFVVNRFLFLSLHHLFAIYFKLSTFKLRK